MPDLNLYDYYRISKINGYLIEKVQCVFSVQEWVQIFKLSLTTEREMTSLFCFSFFRLN